MVLAFVTSHSSQALRGPKQGRKWPSLPFTTAVLAAILGLAALQVTLFLPLGIQEGSTTQLGPCPPSSHQPITGGLCARTGEPNGTHTSNIPTIASHLPPRAIAFIVAAAVVVLSAIPLSAWLHDRTGRRWWLAPMWLGALGTETVVVLAGFSFGLFFMPAAFLAIAASVIATFSPTRIAA